MAILTLEIPEERQSFLSACLHSGSYKTPDDVVNRALQLLEQQSLDDERKVIKLREAIQLGLDAEFIDGDIFAQVRQETGLPARTRNQ